MSKDKKTNKKYEDASKSQKITTVFFTFIAIIFAIVSLYPYYFTIIASLRKGIDVYSPGFKLSDLSFHAYKNLLFNFSSDQSVMLGRWILNTTVITVVTTFLTLLVSSTGGYALARMDFPGKKLWFSLILGVMMIPSQVTLVPKYIMITNLFNWGNTYIGLVVPFIFSAYFTFMMRQFFLSFPKEVEEAAILDGMSRVGVFIKMVLPLSKAPLLASGTLIFMGVWGSYLWPKLLISKLPMYMISQGMTVMMGSKYTVNPSLQMAAAILSTLPLILLFMFLQKYFMGSIAKSGSKGA